MKARLTMGLAALLAISPFVPAPAQQWQPAPGPLMTQWSKQVSPTNALPDYPRPQMARTTWQNLNGLWDYALTGSAATTAPATYSGQILVPYAYESALSGVGKPSIPGQSLWYHRTFTIPAAWQGQRVLLHFGAVNWDSAVIVNGKPLGTHRGGYDAFDYDITGSLQPGANELVVSAWNPLRADTPNAQVLGKQRARSGGIFYTAATGIWQTVWLEPVPAAHIVGLKITPDVDGKKLRVAVETDGAMGGNYQISARATASGMNSVMSSTEINKELALPVLNPHLWTPDDPFLYNLTVELKAGDRTQDSVGSYFAMRKISLGKDDQGRTRIFLNNKFLFQVGALDQGYWPDGIYTAPTDEALRYDIEMAKKVGWNLLRKHAKVEPQRWYYWTDKLGMLVWQDMPQAFGDLNDEAKQQWDTEWRREIAEFYNFPSIIVWTTFNEGWGQHDTERIVEMTRQLDPSRLINNASGWTDKGVGDINDTHAYRGPWAKPAEAARASVCGEFGGLALPVAGHRWNQAIFGYGAVIRSSWQLTQLYQDLLKKGYRLRDEQGASALVYTQVTDVEQEINGLLTYDRAVVKPDLAIVAAANKGEFLPLPPNPNPELVPASDDQPFNWRYSTDKPAGNWMQPAFDAGGWKTGPAPFGHEMGGVRTEWTTPDLWIRREFTLPDNIPAKLTFQVKHDEDAEIYLNGVLAAGVTGFTADYVPVPMNDAGRAALKPGKNVLAVHVHQTIGGQGIDVGIAAGG